MPVFRYVLLAWVLFQCKQPSATTASWCAQSIRPEFSQYKEVQTKQPWFKVYEVGKGVYAIAEPYNFQEVISYLIIGTERTILFDTGMGMGNIREVVAELSGLPVMVINSHTHYDHIGGNHQFETVLAVDTSYTQKHAREGWTHDLVRQEVKHDAFCAEKLPGLDTAKYSVKPYADKIKGFLTDGDTLRLGNRTIEILQVPGHTPDCLALLDRENGYLWTGDMYYEATIWLFFDGTDLDTYASSIARFADLATSLQAVFPAHNTPVADPAHLIDLKAAFTQIRNGEVKPKSNPKVMHPEDGRAVTFDFRYFSFRIRKDLLE